MFEDRGQAPAPDCGDGESGERIRGEEDDHRGTGNRQGTDDVGGPPVRPPGHGGEDDHRQHRDPHQERPSHATPEPGQPVGGGARLAAVIDDVGE